MPHDMAVRAADLIAELAQYHQVHTIGVNGHGESTFPSGWTGQVAPLLQRSLPVSITSNLAKNFTPEEFSVLAAFRNIAVSIDPADPVLLRRMRRKVDLRRITGNIASIRAEAARLGRQAPNFTFLAGLFHPCALTLVGLVELAVALGIRRMGFWDLKRYDYSSAGLAPEECPTPLDELDDATLQGCLDEIGAGLRILEANRITFEMHADFVGVLAKRRGLRFA
jgi:hypothetical protein